MRRELLVHGLRPHQPQARGRAGAPHEHSLGRADPGRHDLPLGEIRARHGDGLAPWQWCLGVRSRVWRWLGGRGLASLRPGHASCLGERARRRRGRRGHASCLGGRGRRGRASCLGGRAPRGLREQPPGVH
eukprot:11176660-Lingulodinium_polyedra.AAC.3